MADEKDKSEQKAPETAKAGSAAKETTKEGAPKEATKEHKGAKAEGAEGKAKVKTKKSKAKRRIVTEGRVYIQASFNNTIITVTDPKGEVIAQSSAGANGFKGPKKATPYAAQVSAENAITKAKVYGLEKVMVFVKGAGSGREQAIRGLQAGGVNIETITDVTPVAHNGCRPRKSRRV